MKKINILTLVILISLLTACNSIKEYTGTKIIKLTYSTIDYMGGYTEKYVLDFTENKYSTLEYLPAEGEEPQLELKNTFTDEEEKVFMDLCYSYGLFDLNESYTATGIDDGGGWNLIIEYEDGITKTSRGSNAGPTKVFSKCATVFYDLCGEVVLGSLPEFYVDPPTISQGFRYENAHHASLTSVTRANYKWNKNEVLDKDIYSINEKSKQKNQFENGYNYQLILYTANYRCDEKFNKIVVKEYDYTPELTNEKVIYTGKWFDQIELDIELNKIYIYELRYKDGDFVQFTFNTYCKSIENQN